MQNSICISADDVCTFREGIQLIIIKPVNHQHGSIGDPHGPLVQPFQDQLDDALGFPDLLHIIKGLPEIPHEVILTAEGAREIEPMKYRELLFGMENGQIEVGVLIYLHAIC